MILTDCWNCKTKGKFSFISETAKSWMFKCKNCNKANVVDKPSP